MTIVCLTKHGFVETRKIVSRWQHGTGKADIFSPIVNIYLLEQEQESYPKNLAARDLIQPNATFYPYSSQHIASCEMVAALLRLN